MPLEKPIDFDVLTTENLDLFYGKNAVHLEGFIKGAMKYNKQSVNRLWTFDNLRALVEQSIKLTNSQPAKVDEPLSLKGALALIDYFSVPQNAPELLNRFNLSGYKAVKESFHEPNASNFKTLDDGQYLPNDLATRWENMVTEFKARLQQELGKTVNISIASGYRSPAYQLYLLCAGSYRKNSEGVPPSLSREFKIITPPFCSKHSIPENPAIDVDEFFPDRENSLDGAKSCEEIRANAVWKIFKTVAEKHHFYENYPLGSSVNNGFGESWEFQYRQNC